MAIPVDYSCLTRFLSEIYRDFQLKLNLTILIPFQFTSVFKPLPPNSKARPNSIFHYYSLIHSDEGLTLETSVFESFTVANLPYRPCS